jgi:cytosine/adenosine deaminase-related metal-dependent hydrolase
MVDFLLQVMGLRGESLADPAGSARAADRQMHEAGIVAVGDISNNISTLPIKAGSPLYYHTFVEVAGFVPTGAEARLQQALQVYNGMCRVLGEEAVTLVPHAPYSVSKPLFEALNRAAQGRCLTIHNQESEAENQFYRSVEGDFLRLYATLGLNIDFFSPYHSSSLATFLPWLSLPRSVLLVHNVATSADDITRVQAQSEALNQEFFWCLCPGANEYIQQTLPPVRLLRKAGCAITLGTDSLASNYGLSILSEMKMIQDDFPEIPLQELLVWGTANGARALHIGDRFGSFTKGKQPGVLLLRKLEAGRISGQTTVTRLL